jgi:AcrR family transcriptional regulator
MKKTMTKQRLLEATLKLVSEKGYLGSTTREIAHEAGVTELTLFRHFGTKEKLFEELLNNHTFLPKLKELLPELDGLAYEEGLRLIATRFLLSLKERKSMVKIMYSEVTIYPDKIKALYNKFVDDLRSTLATYFRSLQKKGVLRQVAPELAARVFLGMLFAYFRSEEIMRPGGMKKKAMEQQVQELIDIFVRGTMNSVS